MGRVFCDWGLNGLQAHAEASVAVIVDVLSFSTAVDIAVGRGAEVLPFRLGERAAAEAAARKAGAVLALPRKAAGGQFSLSPRSLLRAEPGLRLMLPSPNGSRLSLEAPQTSVFAGCLRNARAVAAAAEAAASGGDILVLAAGERWPDGGLRPAIEDWLGAGAIIARLAGGLSPEAAAAKASWLAAGSNVPQLLRECPSGRELIEVGFAGDVEIAAEVGLSDTAPRLVDGAFRS